MFCPYQVSVDRRVDEPRVGVSVHQGVDLQLGLVEGVLRRGDHVAVDDLTNPGVQAHLKSRLWLKIWSSGTST